jgi:hypothetical protein
MGGLDMSTADDLNRQTQINTQKLRPILSKALSPNVFKEVDNQTPPAQYKASNIFLVYFDIYMWLAARSPAETAQIKTIQDLIPAFRRDRDAFLGAKTPASVTDQLDQVGKWPPGQVLLLMIKNQSDKITIVPDFISKVSGHNDVGGVPDSIAGATSIGMPVLDTVNWEGLPGGPGDGTGTGSDYTLNYSPELYGRKGTLNETYPGSDPDELLFHELVHAERSLEGVTYFMPVGNRYDNEEEYLAVVLTNIYLSSKGVLTLRGNHYEGALISPEKFLDNVQQVDEEPRMLLERFRLRQPTFFDMLAKPALAKFNPVLQYGEELKSGKASAGALKKRR